LADSRTLAGTVPGVHGNTIRSVSYSRVRPRDRLAAWARLLALTAARPERPFQSIVIGRAQSGSPQANCTTARVAPLDQRAAREQLAILVDLYDRGMREPLPIACQSSAAYAQAAGRGEDSEAAAKADWETSFRFDKEDREPEHQLVYGAPISFGALLRQRPRPDEHGPGWPVSEETRFGRYARRLWDGLLAQEVVSDR
ncbi:MAG: hypothetical protein JO372_19845, partial [Solirubrobacterales bacterium]|nr:hypothetical protein [Solirubrobacterales bacterium]